MATAPNWGKGRNLRVMGFSAYATTLLLADAINTWLLTLTEEELLVVTYQSDAAGHHALITYTEE